MKIHSTFARLLPLMLVAVLGLAGCAREIGPNVVAGPAVGATGATYRGTIERVRPVLVQESETLQGNTTGLLLGGLVGGAAASRIDTGGDFGEAVVTGLGAAAGAGLGALTEREVKRQQGIEYVVQTDSGRLLTVVQGPPALGVGQRVYVQVPSRGRATVTPIPY